MASVKLTTVALLSGVFGMALTNGAVGQNFDGTCFIDYFREGKPCVCRTETGVEVLDEKAGAAACLSTDEQELTRAVPDRTPPTVTPPGTPPGENPPETVAKGNNGIGNDEVGDPPGIGNSENDEEGERTAQTDGPGARGPGGSRPSQAN